MKQLLQRLPTIFPLLMVSTLLTGCIYSGTQAPIFANTQAKQQGLGTQSVNVSRPRVPIAAPQTPVVLRPTGTQNDPYAVASRTETAIASPTVNEVYRTDVASNAISKTSEASTNTTTKPVTEEAQPKTVIDTNPNAGTQKPAAASASATTALLQEARNAVGSGDYDKAASALERAHRIEPGNAKILYDIAQIRYAQGNYAQAESFANKAATLSGSSSIAKKSWQLLSNARSRLGNTTGAKAAAAKVKSL